MTKSEEELMKEKIYEIFQHLSKNEINLLWRIVEAERERLHMSKPRGIYEAIIKALEEEIH
jgi:hypothetical protein